LAISGTYLFAGTDNGLWRRPLSEIITGIEKNLSEIPAQFGLGQNYPNPFNPTTTIGYTLAKNSKVLLKVYDLLGREVATLVNGEMKGGVLHKVSFDGSRFVSGIYFYRLQAGNYIETRKLVLLK
jgi:hypothetical protein